MRPRLFHPAAGGEPGPGRPAHAHAYKLREDCGRPLLDNGGIYLLELKKFQAERIAGSPGF